MIAILCVSIICIVDGLFSYFSKSGLRNGAIYLMTKTAFISPLFYETLYSWIWE